MFSWRDNRLSANGDTQARRAVFVPGLTDHFALTYDGLNRLKSVTGPVAESFTLDGASNITARTGPNQIDTYDNANRITSDGTSSYTWSNADRLTNRAADAFGYDPLDRMTSSTVAGSARTYAYNGDGLLQSRTGAGATTFLWDPATSPSRELKQGSDNLIYGLGPLYVVKADATTLTFARDGSKNLRAELTSTGAVTAAFRYRAYGQIAQATGVSPGYLGLAGQMVDPSGLVYMRARWYDPSVGRLLTRDPQQGSLASPGSLNSYGYAFASPLMLSDPSGYCPSPSLISFCVQVLTTPVAIPIGPRFDKSYVFGESAGPRFDRTYVFPGADTRIFWDKANGGEETGDQPAGDGTGTQVQPGQPGSETGAEPKGEPKMPAPPDERGPWQWRGGGEEGTKEGGWFNPDTGEWWHPHPVSGHGPHWDVGWRGEEGYWRVYPGGGEDYIPQ
jgi:RHS repeat-associated protein